MSEIFAEATVRISPALGDFVTRLDGLLKEAMKNVKVPPVRVAPALSKDFIGDLRTQVNAAIVKAQSGIKPIRVKALIEPIGVSGRVPAGGGIPGGGRGKDNGGGSQVRTSAANQALTRSLEHITTAQLNLNRAFDESIPLEEQAAAVTKVTTSLDNAQTAAENALTKAIVAKNAAVQKSARRQLTDIEDFRKSIAGRVAQTTAVAPVAEAGTTKVQAAAIAQARKGADATRAVVAGLRETNTVSKTLSTTTKDLAAQQDLLKKQSKLLADASRAVKTSLTAENQVVRAAALNAQKSAQAQVDSTKQRISAINQVAKAEEAAAKQSAKLAQQTATARQRAARAAAAGAASEKRRTEQTSRGAQASVLSLAGIRGATLAASRSFLVGAAAITVFARAVKQFADLERNLDVFRATTSATANQMEAVREEATALGADLTLPSVAAGDAAGAMVELAKAGLSVEDSIAGARGVLELATAAAIDTADAVRLTANVLNAFSLSGREAITVADVLANAANASQGSIADMGVAFQQAASAGHQVGLSFQDTATFLTILAKNGLRGSDAGTSLRTALIRLINPSKEAAAQFEKLGIVLRDASGNLRADVFLQIANATDALTPAARDATIALIGGQDAFRAVTILGRQTVGSFLAMRAALRQTGTAAELAKARTEGLHGAMDGLQSVLETIGTTAAGHVGPALAQFVRTVSGGLTSFAENQQVAETLDQTLGATATSFNILGKAISSVAAVALPLAGVLAKTATSIGVTNILAGVVAYKALSAALDGAILRLRILKPLVAIVATAKIGEAAAISAQAARVTAATSTLQVLPIKGFGRLTQVEQKMKATAVLAESAAPKISVFSRALASIGPAASAAAASTTVWVAAIAVAAGALVFLATRSSAAEKAASNLAKKTDALAEALGRAKLAAQELASQERDIEQQGTSLQQAVLNQIRARNTLASSTAAPGSVERKQQILDVAIATQDLAFATQDYNKALKDLTSTREAAAAANDEQTKKLNDEKTALFGVLAAGASFGDLAGGNIPKLISRSLKDNVALVQVLNTLDKQSKKNIASGDDEAKSLGRRQAALKGLLSALKLAHRDAIAPIVITTLLKAPNLAAAIKNIVATMKFGSEEARRAFIENLLKFSGLGPAVRRQLEKELLPNIKTTIKSWGSPISQLMRDVGKKGGEAFTEGFRQGFDSKLLEAEMKGVGLAGQLAIAQTGVAKAQATFDRREANLPPQGKRGAFQQHLIDQAGQRLKDRKDERDRIQGEIDAIDEKETQDVKDAQQKRDTAGQKLVDAITEGKKATRLQRAITSAGLTEWLGDDLKTTQAWVNFLKKQKVVLLARLKAIGASKAVITSAMKAINDLIFDTTNEIKRLTKEQEDNTKARQDALAAIVNERLDLRIQIAESRGNAKAILAAHRAKLAEITKELVRARRQYGKNSIEWLRLKAAQADEIAKIKELEGQTKTRNGAFAKLTFEFLQAQQGFAANLLGNLIPLGAADFAGRTTPLPFTQGAVDIATPGSPGSPGFDRGGNPTHRPGANLAKAQATAGTQGSTAGQMSILINLTRAIHSVLQSLNSGTKHPEAHHQKISNAMKNKMAAGRV